jgi:sulfatase maturation enzyme AslB (radical SAM superfamily)
MGLRQTGRELSAQDFNKMPLVCRNCPYAPQCRGGCRCEWSLVETPFGRMDYLADPTNIAGSKAFTVDREPAPACAPAA